MDPWVQNALFASGAALSGAIGMLWRHVQATQRGNEEHLREMQSKTESKLDQCEEKHETTMGIVIDLTREIGDLKEVAGRYQGIEFLAKKVLEAIDRGDDGPS